MRLCVRCNKKTQSKGFVSTARGGFVCAECINEIAKRFHGTPHEIKKNVLKRRLS